MQFKTYSPSFSSSILFSLLYAVYCHFLNNGRCHAVIPTKGFQVEIPLCILRGITQHKQLLE